jgi:uncharacterized protein YjbI with pentapeptide repeats
MAPRSQLARLSRYAVPALLLAALLLSPARPAAGQVSDPTKQRLQNEKLENEIRKLRLENERSSSLFGAILALAPFVTVLVAVTGVGLTLWKQLTESTQSRREAMRQQELDREQRERESLRRFDESYGQAVQNLAADSRALQVSAAVSLMSFLKSRYEEFHPDILALLIAHLKLDREEAVNKLLVQAFERAIRLEPARQALGCDLDLARAQLSHVNLESVELSVPGGACTVDFAFANLSHATLVDVALWRARGYGANLDGARLSRANLQEARLNKVSACDARLHGTILISATLKDSDLQRSEFCQARMQSAHLEGANLAKTRFEGANLSDAYFTGAKGLEPVVLKTITRANNWRNAHFDDDTAELLHAIARNQAPTISS